MKRVRALLLCACAAILLVHPAGGCAFEDEPATFVAPTGPDGSYAAFAAGRIGIPQRGYRTRHLVVIYNYLTGRKLSPQEQQAAAAVNEAFLEYGEWSEGPASSGEQAWLSARKPFGTVDGQAPVDAVKRVRAVPGEDYQDFENCLEPAFAAAARTLADRVRTVHSPQDPAVIEWVRGQDAVFANCSEGTHMPSELPAGAPRWLQQDRAYQRAAAEFYSLNFPAALTAFRGIAADTASPWSTTARYMVARTLIRRASLDSSIDPATGKPAPAGKRNYEEEQDRVLKGMRSAQGELRAMRSEPRMHDWTQQIDALLDYVNARVEPEQQAIVLAARLRHADAKFGQDLVDLTYVRTAGAPDVPDRKALRTSLLQAVQHQPNAPAEAREGTQMVAWINAMNDGDLGLALAEWHARHTPLWLLAAMTAAKPSDAQAAELITAAKAVPQSDPAYRAVTFHRLRLSPRDAGMRAELLQLTPKLTAGEGGSTANMFAELDAESAPTLAEWLPPSARVPAYGPQRSDVTPEEKPQEQACGPALLVDKMRLFTNNAAESLNTQMPLAMLAKAAESNQLPPHLRFWLAQATWTRAVLLERPEIARRMSPILVGCRAAWKPVLDAYDAAAAGDARRAAGLLAMMRFASTEPNVRAGSERFAFATYDSMRDNWWCSATYTAAVPDDARAKREPAPEPLFISPAQRAETQREVARIAAVGSASDYFAKQALAWWHEHPRDPRTPEILGEAMRVVRNACRNDGTPKLSHALFDALHHDFPQSEWARRYATWE